MGVKEGRGRGEARVGERERRRGRRCFILGVGWVVSLIPRRRLWIGEALFGYFMVRESLGKDMWWMMGLDDRGRGGFA